MLIGLLQLIPIAMILLGVVLLTWSLMIVTARADRRTKDMRARENLRRALGGEHDNVRNLNRWS